MESAAGSEPASSRERQSHRILKPGENFGNYRVVKCISSGLMVNYFHMQHVRDLHDVTVGIFHPRTMQDSRFLKRLQALQKTLQTLSHESLLQICECSIVNERHCIFLDLLEGKTLSRYFGELGDPGRHGIPPADAARVLAQLHGVLGYAHVKGVDHRDLDSDLIFMQDDGSLRVLGFGIKAALGVELFESIVSASVSPLASNKTVGRLNSFDVMSPEYRAGVPEDKRVDIYAVGVIGYWLITAKKPDPAHYQPPSALVEGLTPGWDVFIENSLHRNTEERYQSSKVALLGLKATEREPESEGAGFIQRQIDRIPVPKGILARGESAARIYRLSIIGVVGVVLTALMASFLQSVFTEPEENTRTVARVATEGMNPDLRINIQPASARVQFVRYGDRFATTKGRLELLVLPGDYEVRITSPQHAPQVIHVQIEQGVLSEVNVQLVPAWRDVELRSEPGAAVFVREASGLEIELGLTNAEGRFILQEGDLSGAEQIVIRKEGYEALTLFDDDAVFGEVLEVEAPLIALPVRLRVDTDPAGARVTVNDVEVGATPLSIGVKAPADTLEVSVQMLGYRQETRSLEVRPGQDFMVDFGELQSVAGELVVDLSFPAAQGAVPQEVIAQAKVEIDGALYSLDAEALKRVPEGVRQVRVIHPLYASEMRAIDVRDGEVHTLNAELRPRPGVVTLTVPQGLDYEVRLDGDLVELIEGRVMIAANRRAELEVRIHDHLTMVRQLQLSPNQRVNWELVPVPIPPPTAGENWMVPYRGIEFAWVDAGSFVMGSPLREPGRIANEGPATRVRFTQGFWAGIYEVTQAQFMEIMGENPSEFVGPRHPVDSVTFNQAQEFCRLLTQHERAAGRLPEGYIYRLPTEAEWEYAARGGNTDPFSFGSRADATAGNFRGVYPTGSSGLRSLDTYGTVPVGSYAPNAFGLYDVHGNAEEWTLDHFNGRLPGGSIEDPDPRRDGPRMAVRGGSWADFAVRTRSAVRDQLPPETESHKVGFRVFLAPERK